MYELSRLDRNVPRSSLVRNVLWLMPVGAVRNASARFARSGGRVFGVHGSGSVHGRDTDPPRARSCRVHKSDHAARTYSWTTPPRRSRRWIRASPLWLLKSPFSLRALILPPTADTLLGDDVRVPVRPPDPANIGALARRPPARNPGVTAPAAGAATHSTAAAAARDDRPVRLGRALAPLDPAANGARHRRLQRLLCRSQSQRSDSRCRRVETCCSRCLPCITSWPSWRRRPALSPIRPSAVADLATGVAAVARRAGAGSASHRRPMASRSVRSALVAPFATSWTTTHRFAASRSDWALGRGESSLGRSADSRRAAQARTRRLRTHGVAVAAGVSKATVTDWRTSRITSARAHAFRR